MIRTKHTYTKDKYRLTETAWDRWQMEANKRTYKRATEYVSKLMMSFRHRKLFHAWRSRSSPGGMQFIYHRRRRRFIVRLFVTKDLVYLSTSSYVVDVLSCVHTGKTINHTGETSWWCRSDVDNAFRSTVTPSSTATVTDGQPPVSATSASAAGGGGGRSMGWRRRDAGVCRLRLCHLWAVSAACTWSLLARGLPQVFVLQLSSRWGGLDALHQGQSAALSTRLSQVTVDNIAADHRWRVFQIRVLIMHTQRIRSRCDGGGHVGGGSFGTPNDDGAT